MTVRPDILPLWATNNSSGCQQPDASLVETGYVADERPTYDETNWLYRQYGLYLQYLDSKTNSVTLASTLEPSIRLLSSGALSWNLSASTLSWAAPLHLAYPGVADQANTIAAGSAVIPSGSVAYVQANAPFSTVASTTSGSAQLTSVAYADQIGVGWGISGPGIPSNTVVQSLGSDGSSVQMSQAASATNGSATLTFAASGALTVQVAPMATLTPSVNMVLFARATETRAYVGVGTAQMVLHDGESKLLLEDGFSVRRLTAGSSLQQLQAVYISPGASDTASSGVPSGRTAGQVYLADSSATYLKRAAVVGFAISNQSAGDLAQIATSGLLGGFSNLTPGATYFLDPATPGGITTTKPTAAGQFETPVGIAASATSLLLNASAAEMSRPVPNSLTLPGTLSANSVVSAQGFCQQIDMGGMYVQSGNNMYSSSAGKVVPIQLQKFYAVQNSASGYAASRSWAAGAAGSVLRVQIYSSLALTSSLQVQIFIISPNQARPDLPAIQFAAGSLSQAGSNTFTATASFAKGTYQFLATDVLQAKIGFASSLSSDVVINVDMTVEMAA